MLSVHRLPGRLTPEQVAMCLGFEQSNISILVRAKLLKPLGHPPANGNKFFASCEIERLRIDVDWLSRASDALVRHWKKKNSAKTNVKNNL